MLGSRVYGTRGGFANTEAGPCPVLTVTVETFLDQPPDGKTQAEAEAEQNPHDDYYMVNVRNIESGKVQAPRELTRPDQK